MTHEEMLDAAARAVGAARAAEELRRELRWSAPRQDPDRQQRIEAAIAAIDAAMKPVRQAVGHLTWEPLGSDVESVVRDASKFAQYQRKQLKKMRP